MLSTAGLLFVCQIASLHDENTLERDTDVRTISKQSERVK